MYFEIKWKEKSMSNGAKKQVSAHKRENQSQTRITVDFGTVRQLRGYGRKIL